MRASGRSEGGEWGEKDDRRELGGQKKGDGIQVAVAELSFSAPNCRRYSSSHSSLSSLGTKPCFSYSARLAASIAASRSALISIGPPAYCKFRSVIQQRDISDTAAAGERAGAATATKNLTDETAP